MFIREICEIRVKKIKMAKDIGKPNRLFTAMIVVSLVIHGLLLMYIADIYGSNQMTRINLTLRDVSKPVGRPIPHPRPRHHSPQTHEADKIDVPRHKVLPVKAEDLPKDAPDKITEAISVPDIPGSSVAVAGAPGGWSGGAPVFATTRDYFDMVRMKIESCKKYPDAARENQIQGRVGIRFVIGSDGEVSSVKITNGSGNAELDRAALEAVREASPMPSLPRNLFDEKTLQVEITMVFELR